jgi:FkbM family methyltransferase
MLDGVKVPLKASPLSHKMRRHLMRGGYERAERRVVAELVGEGAKVIELGSSLGILTSLLKRKVGPSGKVVAVEANRALAEHFSRQLAANGMTTPLVHALGYPLWEAQIPASVRKRKFAAQENNLSGRAGSDREGTEVPWRTLKEISTEAELPDPDVLVVDVEGGETAWCTHPPDFPASVSVLIVEIHPHLIGERRAGECVQAILDAGFRIDAISATVFGFRRKAVH